MANTGHGSANAPSRPRVADDEAFEVTADAPMRCRRYAWRPIDAGRSTRGRGYPWAMTDERDPAGAAHAPHLPHGEAVREVTGKVASGVASGAAQVGGAVVDAADDLVHRVRPTAEHLAAATLERASPRRRLRRYRIHRRPTPPPNLYDVHPEARTAPVRELGLEPIAVDEVVGTAVEGVAQRGLDFQPLPDFRSKNWQSRWQRIVRAVEQLRSLPPKIGRAHV